MDIKKKVKKYFGIAVNRVVTATSQGVSAKDEIAEFEPAPEMVKLCRRAAA